jgi:serine protease AprX
MTTELSPRLESKGTRSSALWGRRKPTSLLVAAALAVPFAFGTATAAADGTDPASSTAYVQPTLLDQAADHPSSTFNVIVQGADGTTTAGVDQAVQDTADSVPGASDGTTAQYSVIDGVSAQLTGAEVIQLANDDSIDAIVPDLPVASTGAFQGSAANGYSNSQLWSSVAGVTSSWLSNAKAPTIAIVDSGIDSQRADFASRVIGQVNFAGSVDNSPGDGYGHGTLVAGIAAGQAPDYAGVAPTANLLSLDVMNDHGVGRTSSVIAAAQWIYKHRAQYNIKVANFSLTGSLPTSFQFDPLDKAVEKLWLSGVVVVTAAGNYGNANGPSGVPFAPGNDPLVLTVGAADTNGTLDTADDTVAPWSAWGYTPDGFAKPDLIAPGRHIAGPVPVNGVMTAEGSALGRSTGPGYMWMSGTSFAAPVVSGIAAYLMAIHPTWTPDQVKGALMGSASSTAAGMAGGVGEASATAAVAVTSPVNPNAGLDRFLMPDPLGSPTPVLDTASWSSAASSNASWSSASWSSASWSSASWSSASWSSASWASASWSSASWSSASWSSASWSSSTTASGLDPDATAASS